MNESNDSAEPEVPSVTVPPPTTSVPQRPGPGLPAAVGWLLLVILTQFIIQFLLGLVLGLAFVLLGQGPALLATMQNPMVLLAIETTTLFLTVLLFVELRVGSKARLLFAIRWPWIGHIALILCLTLPLSLIMGEVGAIASDVLRKLGTPERFVDFKALQDLTTSIFGLGLWPGVAFVLFFGSLFPAVGEELFFRGFLGRGLVARWGVVWGVFLTSLLFGLIHLYPAHIMVTFVAGLVLHAVYIWSQSLVACMFLHGMYNGLAFLLNAYSLQENPAASTEHLPPVLTLASLLACAGVMVLLYKSRICWLWPDGTRWSPGFAAVQLPPVDCDVGWHRNRLRSRLVLAVAAIYVLFLTALGWEISR